MGLEAYLSRIASIQIRYRVRSIDDSPLANQVGIGKSSNPGIVGFKTHYDIIDAFPSYRRYMTSEYRLSDGTTQVAEIHSYFDGKQLTKISPDGKSASVLTSSGPEPLYFPLHSIGRRVNPPSDLSLADCFLPEFAEFWGKEVLDGVNSSVIVLGPGLPQEARPPGIPGEMTLKIWVAADLGFIVKRWRIDYGTKLRGKNFFAEYENFDFRSTTDHLRGAALPFPRRVVYRNNFASQEWLIEDVVLNPATKSSTFEANVPAGYTLFVDGIQSSPILTGGEEARRQELEHIVRDANRLLDATNQDGALAGTEQRSSWSNSLTLVLVCFVIVAFAIAWRKYRWISRTRQS